MVDTTWDSLSRRDHIDHPSGVARPCVAVALDAFGAAVLNALDAPSDATTLLDIRAEADPAAKQRHVHQTLVDVLAGPAWAGARRIEPRLVILATFGGNALDDLTDWLAPLLEQTVVDQVRLSVVLITQLVTRGEDAAAPERVDQQAAALVTDLLAPGQPGHGRVSVVLVSDRSGGGHMLDSESCMAKARHLLTCLLDPGPLGYQAQAILTRSIADFDERRDPWSRTAAFAAYDLHRLIYPVAETRARWDRLAAGEMEPALFAPPPAAPRTPPYPNLSAIDAPRLPRLSPPQWTPALISTPEHERRRVAQTIDDWLARADAWRREQVSHRAMHRHELGAEAARAIADYREALERDIEAALADPTTTGFWPVIERLLLAARSECDAARLDRNLSLTGEALVIPPPQTALDASHSQMQNAIERRLNGRLLALLIPVTAIIIWLLIVMGARSGSFSLPELVWVGVQRLWSLPGPAWGWAAVVLVGAMATIAGVLSLTARYRLEHAWHVHVHQPASRWTQTAARSVRAAVMMDTASAERDVDDAIATHLAALEQRLTTLREAFVARQTLAHPAEPELRDRFTDLLIPTPTPDSEALNTEQIVRAFRRDPYVIAWLTRGATGESGDVLDRLFDLAAKDANLAIGLSTDSADLLRRLATFAAEDRGSDITPLQANFSGHRQWRLRRMLVIPDMLVPAVAAHGWDTIIGTTREDQAIVFDLLVGLTAADLFGAHAEPQEKAAL